MKIEKDMVFDDFTIIKKIGEGGMGEVWLAHYALLDREIALKILPHTDDENDILRFSREVKLQALLNHQCIVKAIRAGFANEHHYFAMNLVDGQDLNYWLKDGVLEERDALKIILAVAEAMEYAWNEHSMTHRDIKPGNIMIDKKLNVYLMDLGLSKLVDSTAGDLTMTGTFMGTPHYMSPEQARSEELDQRSDIYSLGATLYKMLTGHNVFEDENDNLTNLLMQLAMDEHKAPSEFETDVSKHCDTLINGMLQKKTNLRYFKWGSLIKDINLVLDGLAPCNLLRVKKEETSQKQLEIKLNTLEHKQKLRYDASILAMKQVKLAEKSIEKKRPTKTKKASNIELKRTKQILLVTRIALIFIICICAYLVFRPDTWKMTDAEVAAAMHQNKTDAAQELTNAYEQHNYEVAQYNKQIKDLNAKLQSNAKIVYMDAVKPITKDDISGEWRMMRDGKPMMQYNFNIDGSFSVKNLNRTTQVRTNQTLIQTWKIIEDNFVQIERTFNGTVARNSMRFKFSNGKLLMAYNELIKAIALNKN